MAEVAQMLGVELEEVFKVTDDDSGKYHNYYKFTEKKGIEVSDDNVKWEADTAGTLVLKWLLIGVARIIKLPWKPAVYDEYYYPIPSDRDLWESRLWIGDNYDNSRFSRGLVCKTKEEAIDMAKKMLAVVKEEQK